MNKEQLLLPPLNKNINYVKLNFSLMNINQRKNTSTVVIGEVLFDHFPSGTKVLGGAPFNVAWNLCGFGSDPLFISAVGADQDGNRVTKTMSDWGMNVAGIDIVHNCPTGTVAVDTSQKEPQYMILPDQAYDRLRYKKEAFDQFEENQHFDLLYHGSLICRTEESWETVRKIKRSCDASIFVDVNLRAPWYNVQLINEILDCADFLKLSMDELRYVTQSVIRASFELEGSIQKLFEKYALEKVWVTAGSEGAYSFSRDGTMHFCRAHPVDRIIDSVGAGDAFTSVVIFGLIHHWSSTQVLEQAVRFASKVCTIHGATVANRDFYSSIRQLVSKLPA